MYSMIGIPGVERYVYIYTGASVNSAGIINSLMTLVMQTAEKFQNRN